MPIGWNAEILRACDAAHLVYKGGQNARLVNCHLVRSIRWNAPKLREALKNTSHMQ